MQRREFLFFSRVLACDFLPDTVLPSGMVADQFERLTGKRFSWLDTMPRRSTGRVRKRDDIETLSRPLNGLRVTDHFTQSGNRVDELGNCQFANRDYQT